MKLSNFEHIKTENGLHYAHVDVVSGIWPFKRIERKEVCREKWSPFWWFSDNGKLVPDFKTEELERSYRARTGKSL